jgi:hypothetical protein
VTGTYCRRPAVARFSMSTLGAKLTVVSGSNVLSVV